MNNNYLFPSLYRTLVPKFIHKKIIAKRVLPKAILNYYNSLEEIHSKELSVALDYLKSKPLNVFPHTFQDKYDPTKVEVFYDIEKKMNFVLLDGKRLFYKRKMSKNRIQKLFNLAKK